VRPLLDPFPFLSDKSQHGVRLFFLGKCLSVLFRSRWLPSLLQSAQCFTEVFSYAGGGLGDVRAVFVVFLVKLEFFFFRSLLAFFLIVPRLLVARDDVLNPSETLLLLGLLFSSLARFSFLQRDPSLVQPTIFRVQCFPYNLSFFDLFPLRNLGQGLPPAFFRDCSHCRRVSFLDFFIRTYLVIPPPCFLPLPPFPFSSRKPSFTLLMLSFPGPAPPFNSFGPSDCPLPCFLPIVQGLFFFFLVPGAALTFPVGSLHQSGGCHVDPPWTHFRF